MGFVWWHALWHLCEARARARTVREVAQQQPRHGAGADRLKRLDDAAQHGPARGGAQRARLEEGRHGEERGPEHAERDRRVCVYQ